MLPFQFEAVGVLVTAFMLRSGSSRNPKKSADLRGWLVLTSQGSQVQSLPRPPFFLCIIRRLQITAHAALQRSTGATEPKCPITSCPLQNLNDRFRPIAAIRIDSDQTPLFGLTTIERLGSHATTSPG